MIAASTAQIVVIALLGIAILALLFFMFGRGRQRP
jgi:LPXTG-motif cell wall-anchored protein